MEFLWINVHLFSLQKLREEEIVLNKILFLYMCSLPASPLSKSHLFIYLFIYFLCLPLYFSFLCWIMSAADCASALSQLFEGGLFYVLSVRKKKTLENKQTNKLSFVSNIAEFSCHERRL